MEVTVSLWGGVLRHGSIPAPSTRVPNGIRVLAPSVAANRAPTLETTMISTVWGSHARPAWIGEYPRISCRYSELKKTTLITAIDMSTCTELPHATEGSLSRRPGSSGCFFFQAEDGIRDVAVTGVQTCALPI